MYSQIASNKRKSLLLMLIFIVVIAGLAWIFSKIYGGNADMVVIAIVFASGMNMGVTPIWW